MKSLQLFFLALLLGLFIGCESDPCEDVECGSGDCVEGICDCPDGFSGVNCEIESNEVCDPQTGECNCIPNYYGDGCDILCVNGEFANGDCNCFEGYEGIGCETEIRDIFVGFWDCDEWTYASQIGGSPIPGSLPCAITIEKGFDILDIKFSTNRKSTLLISPDNKIVGQVTKNRINFELQYLNTETLPSTVYGSASYNPGDRVLSIELYPFNPTTRLTEVARGTFTKH